MFPIEEIKKVKEMYYPQMKQLHIDCLKSLADHEQYPAARCSLTLGTLMYQHSSSQMVEAMNNVNKRIHVCSSIDIINATILLLKMEAERFERQRQLAANSTSFLTPKGSFLQSNITSNAKEHKENFVVGVMKLENEDPPQYECEVRGLKEAWMV